MARQPCNCPSWLDEDACHEWRRLHASGEIHDKDLATVAAYCFTLSWWTKVKTTIGRIQDEGPRSWMTIDGQEQPHPALALEAQLAADLLLLTQALDLDIVGREAPKPSRVLFIDEGS